MASLFDINEHLCQRCLCLVIYEGHDGSFWHRRLRVYRWPGSSWTENHSHPTRSMMLSVAQELQEWPFCGCRRSGDFADLSFESDGASLGQFETWIAQDQLDALGSRFSRRHNLLGRVQVTMLVEQEEVAPGTQFVADSCGSSWHCCANLCTPFSVSCSRGRMARWQIWTTNSCSPR